MAAPERLPPSSPAFDIQSRQRKVFSLNGFRKSSVSKIWLITCLAGSCSLIPFSHLKYFFVTFYPPTWNIQFWVSLAFSKLFFFRVNSIITGALLIYHLRDVERRFGSFKYLNFLGFTWLSSFSTEFLLSQCLNCMSVDVEHFSSGPYPLLISGLVQALAEFPLESSSLGTVILPKLLSILLCLQVFFSSKRVMLSCFCGLISGIVFRWIQNALRFPIPKIEMLGKSLVPFVERWGEDVRGRSLPMGATREAQRQEILDRYEQGLIFQQMQQQSSEGPLRNLPFFRRLFQGADVANLPGVDSMEPSETNIALMQEMGFGDRDRVVTALRASGDDVATAASLLLRNPPPAS